jgi:hypothetical protein
MSLQIEGANKILLGQLKDTGENIWISKPSWDCDWYWSFGYLGNRDCHYHLDDYQNGRNINMYDALKTDYILSENIKDNLWVFCELALSIYQLKHTVELLGRGGSHMTTNPCKDLIKDEAYTKHINEVVLPKVMQHFWNTFK